MHSVVVHGHFYQPPREDPWTEEVDREPGAAPFHDWNERVTQQSYRPVATARVTDASGRVADRQMNLYEWMSFDAGATLLRWMEKHAHDVYRAMVDADRASSERLGGHGNAIAMPFHHVILPLASRRDKATEVRWGLADFQRRFGRPAEGLWLPETAVDEETLVVLAEEGVRFTVLAPHQVENAPRNGEPLRFAAGNGRELALFVYDGRLANDVAFGSLLSDGIELARRLAPPDDERSAAKSAFTLASIATDGETFGHHHVFGEMGLARALTLLSARHGVRVENFASVLARVPPRIPAQLVAPSSWSCAHGVQRWFGDCGCRLKAGTSQAWRCPMRAALDWLAYQLDDRFASDGSRCFSNPWAVRDAFGQCASLPEARRREFAATHMIAGANLDDAARFLEGMKSRLGMFGSCAWFFDDVAGRESELMLRLAAHAVELLGDPGIEGTFLARLAAARSNDPVAGDGAAVYRALQAGTRAVVA